jgi:predicted glycogen debranching enzyme
MRYSLDEVKCRNLDYSSKREWLLTNGLGGFAMGSVSGINTRRYHGHLVAATKPPTDRMVLLAAIDTFVQTDGTPIGLSCNQYPGAVFPEGYHYLRGFTVGKKAVWRYRAVGLELEKRLALHPGSNTSTIIYQNVGDASFLITLRPLVSHKPYHENFLESGSYPEVLRFPKHHTVVEHQGVALTISHEGAQRIPVQGWYYRFEHAREYDRGLDPRDDLFCPCELRFELAPGESATLVASTEGVQEPYDPTEDESAEHRLSVFLRAAAEQFIVTTHDRTSIIAGYPWFTDWGRDTMISLPGICLHSGRIKEARQILRDYASQMHQGLIPNRFTSADSKPDYNTVDATLWFANAIYKTLEAEWDLEFAKEMRLALMDVYDWHQRGTLFGIGMDPEDGLLAQGGHGLQLTWMDAKVGDWVVTPRYGKPVEINGLWINFLRVLAFLHERLEDQEAAQLVCSRADFAEESFERKFWHEVRGHYLDTVEPTDASLRPNQLIAMALPFGPAKGDRAKRALDLITRELLTPVGLRTLGPSEPDYKGQFKGSLPELDAAYHQGTVWPWLFGPYVSAMVRLTQDRAEAKRVLRNAKEMLVEYGLGGIAETYDGDRPQAPAGCPWQAWSVAEILRAWVEDAQGA